MVNIMDAKYKEQETYVKIPNYRIGAVIGKNGQDKKDIEVITGTTLDIDSKSGEITIIRNNADAYTFYRTEQVIKSIGRGFSPQHAKLLLESSYTLDIMELKEFGILTDKQMETKRGRIIGTKGSMKRFLEETLDCYVSVQGKTIAIIGQGLNSGLAKEAISKLLMGGNIPAVKQGIQKKLSQRKKNTFSTEEDNDW